MRHQLTTGTYNIIKECRNIPYGTTAMKLRKYTLCSLKRCLFKTALRVELCRKQVITQQKLHQLHILLCMAAHEGLLAFYALEIDVWTRFSLLFNQLPRTTEVTHLVLLPLQ